MTGIFLRATVVTRGWNGYRNKGQHRKSTLEKKILPPFQQGFEPATFQSRVRRSNHWAIPAPFYYYYYWSLLYSAILRSRADSLRSHVILHEWIAFHSAVFLNIHRSGVYLQRKHGWCHKKLLPSRRLLCTRYNHLGAFCVHVTTISAPSVYTLQPSRRLLCTRYNHLGAFCVHVTTISAPSVYTLQPSGRVLWTPYNHAPCHFMQSHICKVCACLAVTCHLRFWQNDRGLLRATAVSRGWNGYRNKNTESWPWRKNYPAAPAGIRTH